MNLITKTQIFHPLMMMKFPKKEVQAGRGKTLYLKPSLK